MRLTGKKLEACLRSARSLLTTASKKSFGRGQMDVRQGRFVSTDGTWALEYQYRADGSYGSDGHVCIVKHGGR